MIQATALSTRPLSTGNLLADCERWCRDSLPPRQGPLLTTVPAPSGRSSLPVARRAA